LAKDATVSASGPLNLMNSLISFFRTKGIAFVWTGAVFAPILLTMGIVDGKIFHLISGIVLFALVVLSIVDGFNALRFRFMTNFIASALVPMCSIAIGTAFAIFKMVNQN
jgi:hypothetical protein